MAGNKKDTRASNGRSSIYLSETDGQWHGWVTMGIRDDGKPDRRHVRGKDQETVTNKVQQLEKQRDSGLARKPGHRWTVAEWLNHWLYTIMAPPTITENAWKAYEVTVRLHLIPGVGAHKLDRLAPEHLERLYRKLATQGRDRQSPDDVVKPASSGGVHQVHRTIRAALNEAKRRKHIGENPAKIARAPKLVEKEAEPYTVEEVKRLLEVAQQRRNGTRWAIALALGLRQGEALGLKWTDINLDAATLVVLRSRLRPKFTHGCSTPCGRKYAGWCPQRQATRPETAPTKSQAGKRGMGLPDQIVAMLKLHREAQNTERATAADMWTDSGYVFATRLGEPLNPRTDWDEWHDVLNAAKVPERRLHDARHTAATVLLLLGVTQRTVMGIMGWSSTSMTARYQHIIDAVKRDVADRVGGLLWQLPGTEDTAKGNADPESEGPQPTT